MGEMKKPVAVISKTTTRNSAADQNGFKLQADPSEKKKRGGKTKIQEQDAKRTTQNFLKQSSVATASQMRPRVKRLGLQGLVFGCASDLLEALQEIDPIHFAGAIVALIE